MLWDLRAKSSPVQATSLSGGGHAHPVYSLAFSGSANAHSLCSVSTDGHLCTWNLAQLSSPSESVQLRYQRHAEEHHSSQKQKIEVAATCMALQDGISNTVCVGAEDGAIYRTRLHGSKAGVDFRSENGHEGPLTGMHFHPTNADWGSSSISNLLLTSSMDW